MTSTRFQSRDDESWIWRKTCPQITYKKHFKISNIFWLYFKTLITILTTFAK